MKNKFNGRGSVFLIIIVVITTFIAVPAVLLYNNFKNITENELGKNAVAIASTVSTLIAEDIEAYSKLNKNQDYKKLSYKQTYYYKMQKIFRAIKSSSNIKYLYTEKRISESQIMYILDAEVLGSKDASPIGSIDLMDDLNKRAYELKRPVYGPQTFSKNWGNLITGYSPIIDVSTGELIGLVGVDISADYLVNILSKLKAIIVFVIIMILLITGYLAERILTYTRSSMEIDYMTGLYNKKYYEQILRQTVKKAEENEECFTVIMIDIDHFKEFNDLYGHQFGDYVLIKIAQVIRDSIRTIDISARYAGDEFIILLPTSTKDSAMSVCRRIKQGISIIELDDENDDTTLRITVSMGISEWKRGLTAEKMTHHADVAMYESKAMGRNTVTVYQHEK